MSPDSKTRRDIVLIPLYLWVSASICLHIFSYFWTETVAAIARRHQAEDAARAARSEPGAQPAEIEFTYVPPAPPPPASAPTPASTPHSPRHEREEREHHTPELARVQPVVPIPLPTPPPPQQRQAVQPPNMESVDQQNHDNQPRPDDPAFLAQSNNNVREQTQAALRNLNRDQANPQVGGHPHPSSDHDPGNSDHAVSADSREIEGSHDHPPSTTPNPTQHAPHPAQVAERDRPSPPSSARASGQQTATQSTGAPGERGTAGTPGASEAAEHGASPNVITSYQGNSSISIASTVHENPSPGQGGQNGANGRNGESGQNGDVASRVGVRGMGAEGATEALTPHSDSYEQVYGREAIHEREVAVERRSQARGNYTDSWRENRASIENYVPSVRVGNQTALRTAQSPFAAYLTGMHRRIHRLFADGYIADLANLPATSPLNDMSLTTTVEIVLERDGSIHRLGLYRTSGNMSFDVASLNSVRHAAPFGTAPEAIVSGDGRVYMHWGFYRNERQCGTFNVDPYILPNPGGPTPAHPNTPHGPAPSDEHPPMPAPSTLGVGRDPHATSDALGAHAAR